MVEREIVKKKQFSSRNNRIVEPHRFNSRFEKLPLSFASLSLSFHLIPSSNSQSFDEISPYTLFFNG